MLSWLTCWRPATTYVSLYNETPDDLNRKYANSYCSLKKEPIYIGSFEYGNREEDGARRVYVYCQNKAGMMSPMPWSESGIEEIRVPYAFYNMFPPGTKKPLSYIYKRKPIRQYRRGICEDNATLDAMASFVDSYHLGVHSRDRAYIDGFGSIRHLMYPWYPKSFDEALVLVEECGTVSICPELGLMLCPITGVSDYMILNRSNHFVGTVDKSGLITIGFEPFLQELLDVISRRKLALRILGVT